MAERVGFEPTVPFRTTVFETVRFGRSRTSPFLGRQGHAAYPDESQDSTKNHEVGRNFFQQYLTDKLIEALHGGKNLAIAPPTNNIYFI